MRTALAVSRGRSATRSNRYPIVGCAVWESFYDLLDTIRATESRSSLGVLLTQAREQFVGSRLEYLEREIEQRLAQAGARPGRERPSRVDEPPPPL